MDVQYALFGQYFRLFEVDGAEREVLCAAPMRDLQQVESLRPFLTEYARRIKAPETDVAAAYLSSYSTGLLLSSLYALSAWNRSLDLDPERLAVQLVQEADYALIRLEVDEFAAVDGPVDVEERKRWVESQLTELISVTLRPYIEAAAAVSGLNARFLWGQMTARIGYYVEYLLADADHASIRSRLSEDYEALLELAPAVFGQARNPLVAKARFVDHWQENGSPLRMKHVCCLYHKTEDGEYCYTCPKMKESERAERASELRARYAETATS
ncbi:hypothetical protein PA598K_02525 [Paenibacillus sp. 598K]|uniref:(2Fe-2S)-binding protein n=1 Tax=Paenibacillus sp. 598K TaxID=1117987 RepID=UPI000FFAB3D8|nr:(2Fe-2S)-binding protein [Paenibacillus sp. 598K]GBF74193.1 hypothetical protein PA598K_02525 [Paenibacillus sp. 598K]